MEGECGLVREKAEALRPMPTRWKAAIDGAETASRELTNLQAEYDLALETIKNIEPQLAETCVTERTAREESELLHRGCAGMGALQQSIDDDLHRFKLIVETPGPLRTALCK